MIDNLTGELIRPFLDEGSTKIKKVVAIYPGRFQPFGPHHKAVYDKLNKMFDDVYISTSNIQKPPRHPLNFKEKAVHISKMGIPKNKIVEERSPYAAINILKNFNSDTTTVVYIVGAKDKGRLSGGRKKDGSPSYFQDYKKNKNKLSGFKDHGYILVAPHVSIKVDGEDVSGTVMRNILGSSKYSDDQRVDIFKKTFGYFNEKIYNMMVDNFKGMSENFTITYEMIDDFILDTDITSIIKESSTTSVGVAKSGIDDGVRFFWGNAKSYKRQTEKVAKKLGMVVVDYIMKSDMFDHNTETTYPKGPVGSVSYAPSGVVGKKSGTKVFELDNMFDAFDEWDNHISNVVLKSLGWEIIDYLGAENVFLDANASYIDDLKDAQNVPEDVKEKNQNKDGSVSERISILDDVALLLMEGGSFGHLQHPFDNKNLTFSDFKQMITMGLSGRLDVEGNVTEKTDGQAIAISWKNNKLIAARNKGDRKNFGENALDINGMISKFEGRGDIRDAFVFSMKDLEKAVSGLSDAQKTKVFAEGEKFMNLEIIWPASSNVINYDKAVLQFHGSTRYDKDGNPIEYIKEDARVLEGMIKQINQHIQKKFTIIKPQVLSIPKHQDFSKKRKYFLSKLTKLQKQYNLSDDDQFGMYHQRFWEEFVYNASKQYKYKIKGNVLRGLTKRWAFFDKSYKVSNIKKDIDNDKFLDWALTFDKKDHKKWVSQNMMPFERLFFELGAEILSNMSGFLAANPDDAVQSIKKEIEKNIKDIRKAKDPKQINLLRQQLEKIQSYGGMDKIVPSEGLTFLYKGELYKITGNFGPINGLLGILKFSR
jgi:hypothetical protein